MVLFEYKAKSISGDTVRGKLYCQDYYDFVSKINERSLYCMKYKQLDKKEVASDKQLNTKSLALCCKQLGAMLSSGLTLIKALDILYKQQTNQKLKHIWESIYEDVQKGKTFSEALKVQSGTFPSYFISMISAGESSGSLDVIIDRMSQHYFKEAKIENRIKTAMIYPIILCCLSLVVIIGMFIFILPNFMKLFDSAQLPPLTKAMMAIVNAITHYWYIFVIVIMAIVFTVAYVLKIPKTRIKIDEKILSMKLIGKLITKILTGRFSRTLASLYSSGIPMIECLERTADVLDNLYIKNRFDEVIDNIKQGEALSTSIQKIQVFDSMLCSMIYIGEESGSLDEILIKISDYYDEESETAIQKMISLLEPVLIIFLGIIIGLIVASIIPALYSSMGSIK